MKKKIKSFRNFLKMETALRLSQSIPDLSDKHEMVIEFVNFLNEIFPNPENLIKFLKVSASFLKDKDDNVLTIWLGSGSNGKSILFKLFEQIFYSELQCSSISDMYQIFLLTDKKENSLLDITDEKYNRKNHFLSICNKILEHDSFDGICVIPFTERFSGDPKKLDQIMRLLPAFAWLLVKIDPINFSKPTYITNEVLDLKKQLKTKDNEIEELKNTYNHLTNGFKDLLKSHDALIVDINQATNFDWITKDEVNDSEDEEEEEEV